MQAVTSPAIGTGDGRGGRGILLLLILLLESGRRGAHCYINMNETAGFLLRRSMVCGRREGERDVAVKIGMFASRRRASVIEIIGGNTMSFRATLAGTDRRSAGIM